MKQKKHIILCVTIALFIAGCIPQTPKVPLPKTETAPQIKQESQEKSCHLNETKPRPTWIDHPPKTDQFLFGVGAAPKQMPVSRQIQAARILAMRDISSQIQVHITSLFQETLTQDNSDIQSQIQQKSEALLRGIEYVDQWNDISNCTIYVLVSVALNKAPDLNENIPIHPPELRKSALIRNITAEGACLIAGISPKQAEYIAKQRARASAIRKGLSAQLNKSVFSQGERAILSIQAQKACQIAVFNIMADDHVVMLHPHPMRPLKTLLPNHVFKIDNLFPEPLAGEKHNVEALFICASMSKGLDFQSLFPVDRAMSFVEFFKRYAKIADLCIDRLIPYEVMSLDSAK